ncbi:hypothetical protein TNCV_119431 [Trichonephila clavipes]|nr:hypothetical protein TNCV_119431 [Trichonephila clavipes]
MRWDFTKTFKKTRVFGKKKFSFNEALDLLQNLPSESSDALIGDSSDEEVPANYVLDCSLDSKDDYQENEQDSR